MHTKFKKQLFATLQKNHRERLAAFETTGTGFDPVEHQLYNLVSETMLDHCISIQPVNDEHEYKFLEFLKDETLVVKSAPITGVWQTINVRNMDHQILTLIAEQLPTSEPLIIKGDTIKEKHECLHACVKKLSNEVATNLFGTANWIVTSEEISKLYQAGVTSQEEYPMRDRISYHGTMANRWRIYSDSEMPFNKMLLGYKGDSYINGGYVFSPSHIEGDQLYFKSKMLDKNFFRLIDVQFA